MKLLSIGTVVMLQGGERKVMITSRTPLSNENGVIGYYDYGACLYPDGQISQETYFFNNEDIVEVIFEGYVDDMELDYRKKYEGQIENINYPKFTIK
ncbi:MAG: DUF4176 domain-containing protein [Anaerorhabdus sp.]